MNAKREVVVVVDGYSSGAFYVQLLKDQSLDAIHVRSTASNEETACNAHAKHILEQWGDLYANHLDGTQPFETLIRQLEEYSLRAILAGSEGSVVLTSKLANHFHLAGNDPVLAESCRNKYLMHLALAEAGLRALNSLLTDDLEILRSWLKNNGGLPVVLKPASSSGADGVHICQTWKDVANAFHKLIGSCSFFGEVLTHVLAQEFASGDEVVVNTASCQKRHMICDLWRYTKWITNDGRSIYDGCELVDDFGDNTDEIITYAFSVLDALGIHNGPAHIEIMLTANGPVLIECGARPMGGSFPQDSLKKCQGRTQMELSLNAYLDPQVFLNHQEKHYALIKYFMVKFLASTRAGHLDAIPSLNLLSALPSVIGGNFLSCLDNFTVQRTVDLQSSPAHLYLSHEDPAVIHKDNELIRALEYDAQNLLFEVSPANEYSYDREWFQHLPDQFWLKTESEAASDSEVVFRALDLKPGMEVLDCPCGDGRIAVHLARRGVKITGLDINTRFIKQARQRFQDEGLTGHFNIGDMRDLPFENQFDAIMNWFNSFGYFDVEDDFEVLKKLKRALRPGGLLVIESPNRSDAVVNTRPKVNQETGTEFQKLWDEVTERLYNPIEVKVDGHKKTLAVGVRFYSLLEYQLLFRLAGLEFLSVRNENLDQFDEQSKRMVLLVKKPL